MLRLILRWLVPAPVRRWRRNARARRAERLHGRISFAYEGEDLILDRIFRHKDHGFYVDVGSCDPMATSNTYYFYRKGWQGLLIEPNLDLRARISGERERDDLIGIGVSESAAELSYYRFKRPEWNTFVKTTADRVKEHSPDQFIDEVRIRTLPLTRILENQKVPAEIDFFSIDVEDMDIFVLRSNDFERFRPRAVVVEVRAITVQGLAESNIVAFMVEQGYYMYAKTRSNTVFVDGRRPA